MSIVRVFSCLLIYFSGQGALISACYVSTLGALKSRSALNFVGALKYLSALKSLGVLTSRAFIVDFSKMP